MLACTWARGVPDRLEGPLEGGFDFVLRERVSASNLPFAGAPPIREHDLAVGLLPIRYLALAHVIQALHTTGLADLLAGKALTVEDLAVQLELDPDRLQHLLYYLINEGLVEVDAGGRYEMSSRGQAYVTCRPWYELLVGGYAQTFSELEQSLRTSQHYAQRNDSRVGKGSCLISFHDALPMAARLLATCEPEPSLIVDLGCGDGQFLLELCQAMGLRGVGIEQAAASVARAQDMITGLGLDQQVTVVQGDALRSLSEYPEERPCYLAAFVLQELLEQRSREEVVDLLRRSAKLNPEAAWIVVEVDHRPDDERLQSNLGLAYYNPYYLLHAITCQRLETREFWVDVAAEAGFDIAASAVPEPSYDSLGLKFALLLRPAGRPEENT